MSPKKVTLATSADWETWIFLVRTQATNSGIWDLVNPDLDKKPDSVEAPIAPECNIPDDVNLFDKNAYAAYKARLDIYKTRMGQIRTPSERFRRSHFIRPRHHNRSQRQIHTVRRTAPVEHASST